MYQLSWEEFKENYGFNKHRKKLIEGIELVIKELKAVGCKSIYIDGSFVSKKSLPNDFDACWDPEGVDYKKLYEDFPIILDFQSDRKKQKQRYGGEIFPSPHFLTFFQTDRDNSPKGIIKLNI